MHVPGFGIKARTDWGKQAFSRSRARTLPYRGGKSEILANFNRGSITCDSRSSSCVYHPTALVNFLQTQELQRRYALQAERRCHIVLHRRGVKVKRRSEENGDVCKIRSEPFRQVRTSAAARGRSGAGHGPGRSEGNSWN